MMTAEGTRQGTFCPEKGAPRPVNERLPTGKGREPVQHGLEGKAVGGGGEGGEGGGHGKAGMLLHAQTRQTATGGEGGGRRGQAWEMFRK